MIVTTMILLALLTPGPETPKGKTVRPTVSYTYATWSTDGRPMIVRVPIHGKRTATLRTGGVQ